MKYLGNFKSLDRPSVLIKAVSLLYDYTDVSKNNINALQVYACAFSFYSIPLLLQLRHLKRSKNCRQIKKQCILVYFCIYNKEDRAHSNSRTSWRITYIVLFLFTRTSELEKIFKNTSTYSRHMCIGTYVNEFKMRLISICKETYMYIPIRSKE